MFENLEIGFDTLPAFNNNFRSFRFSELEEEHEHRVFHLQDLQQIVNGTKKIDARLMLLKRRIVCPGERITFNYKDPKTSVKWQLTCEAIATKHYATFRELLATEGVERCMPGCGDIEKAISACHEQYHQQGYKSRRSEIERGVVAIHLKPISSLKKVVDARGEEKK
jgi:ASC-1-like (ASCH) protein